MSRMSELDLERRDIEDGLRPMDMGTVFYLTSILRGSMGRDVDAAIIDQLLEQHARRYPVLYRNVTNQNRDTASQYSITHPKPGIAVAEKCAAQGEGEDPWLNLPENWRRGKTSAARSVRPGAVDMGDTEDFVRAFSDWLDAPDEDSIEEPPIPEYLKEAELDDRQFTTHTNEDGVLVKTLKPPMLSPRDALSLAMSHIGWLWDIVEEHTRLRREGSNHIHERLSDTLDVLNDEEGF